MQMVQMGKVSVWNGDLKRTHILWKVYHARDIHCPCLVVVWWFNMNENVLSFDVCGMTTCMCDSRLLLLLLQVILFWGTSKK